MITENLDQILSRRRDMVLRVTTLELDANDPRYRHDHERHQRLRDEIAALHRELREIKHVLRTHFHSF